MTILLSNEQILNQSKRACPNIFNVKRQNIYAHKLTHKLG